MLWRVDQVIEVQKEGYAYWQVICLPVDPDEKSMAARLSMFAPYSERFERGDVLRISIEVTPR